MRSAAFVLLLAAPRNLHAEAIAGDRSLEPRQVASDVLELSGTAWINARGHAVVDARQLPGGKASSDEVTAFASLNAGAEAVSSDCLCLSPGSRYLNGRGELGAPTGETGARRSAAAGEREGVAAMPAQARFEGLNLQPVEEEPHGEFVAAGTTGILWISTSAAPLAAGNRQASSPLAGSNTAVAAASPSAAPTPEPLHLAAASNGASVNGKAEPVSLGEVLRSRWDPDQDWVGAAEGLRALPQILSEVGRETILLQQSSAIEELSARPLQLFPDPTDEARAFARRSSANALAIRVAQTDALLDVMDTGAPEATPLVNTAGPDPKVLEFVSAVAGLDAGSDIVFHIAAEDAGLEAAAVVAQNEEAALLPHPDAEIETYRADPAVPEPPPGRACSPASRCWLHGAAAYAASLSPRRLRRTHTHSLGSSSDEYENETQFEARLERARASGGLADPRRGGQFPGGPAARLDAAAARVSAGAGRARVRRARLSGRQPALPVRRPRF